MQTVSDAARFEVSLNISGLLFGNEIQNFFNFEEVQNLIRSVGTIRIGEHNPNLINLTADKFLPKAKPLPGGTAWPIFLILGVSLLSCFLDVYAGRLKPQICSFLHKKRAIERASYLSKKIIAGRAERKANLGSAKHIKKRFRILHLNYKYRYFNS